MLAYQIPVEFVVRHVEPTWNDVDMGLRNGWLNSTAALEIAAQKAARNDASQLEIMLAAAEPTDTQEIAEQVQKLARGEPEQQREQSKRRWLYLILAWLYENRTLIADPLGEVEEIYSDFDYPSDIASFVRYMPPKDGYRPQDHTKEQNTERLFRLWGEYLKGDIDRQIEQPDVDD